VVIRFAEPEDFRVDELPLYPPTGEGAHTFLRVEKRVRTTEQVARDLARAAGVPPRDVGYAGRKDRFAVTTQWFSVPGLSPEAALDLELPSARVVEAAAHPHKLRTGHLRGNRFELVVREVAADVAAEAGRRLPRLVELGMPNRFGAQRFGRDGDNAERGRLLLAGELRVRDRREARFLVSALQAEIFNQVLAARELPLGRVEQGDVAVVHASGGLFVVDEPEREAGRARTFDAGVPENLKPPRGISLRGARRSLRVRPGAAQLEVRGDALHLAVTLPPGSYVTVLLESLLDPAGPDGERAPSAGDVTAPDGDMTAPDDSVASSGLS
jgi:tRNA pseudouridine13 synthase